VALRIALIHKFCPFSFFTGIDGYLEEPGKLRMREFLCIVYLIIKIVIITRLKGG